LFYALATADTAPLVQALEQTYDRPHRAQWVNFLRSHDELDLGRLTQRQRERTFAAFAPDPSMQLYGRGIRRRLAPMLGNDRRRIELAFSLNFTLPGTPMLQYGDEIGLGDDLSLREREAARTPMQWSDDVNGGFSTARKTVLPVIEDPVYGFREVNVASQRRDTGSLLNWMESAIRMRKECPEISWGDWRILKTETRGTLVMRYDWRGHTLVTTHNFAAKPCTLRLPASDAGEAPLVSLLTAEKSTVTDDEHVIELPAFGYRWFRSGGLDRNIPRTTT
jgi:maltose alpha-D-glucosyltransferase/alpha-amylase